MSIKITRGLTAEWFRPASQAESPTPAEFLVRPLSQIELLDVQGMASSEQNGRAAEVALRHGLKDWRGVYDGEVELKFTPSMAARLPAGLILEIVSHLIDLSRVSEDERKN